MKLKKENGVTVIDISIAIVVIFIFISILVALFYSYNTLVQELERKTQAVYYAIAEIEKIKGEDFSNYIGKSIENGNNVIYDGYIDSSDGYYKKVTVEDYADSNAGKEADVVKKVVVNISYKFKNEDQSIEFSTVKTKEN